MTEIIQHKSVYEALAALQAECPGVVKNKKHAQGYKYATLEDWIDTVGPLLAKHGLVFVVSFPEVFDSGEYQTQKGDTWTKVRVRACGRLSLASRPGVNDDEEIVFEGFGEGADPADKAVYKAMTGARKYLYAALSASMTTDDPEVDDRTSARTSAPRTAPKPATAPATAPPVDKRAPAGGPGTITIGQAQDAWKIFRERVTEVAPHLKAKADIEGEFRKVLRAVANVESTKQVPASLYVTFMNVIKGWLPEQEPDPNWGPGDSGPEAP